MLLCGAPAAEQERDRLTGCAIHPPQSLWKSATQSCPNNFVSHVLLGNVYASRNEDDEALTAYSRALEYNPHYMHAHVNAARIYREKRKDAKKAIGVRSTRPHSSCADHGRDGLASVVRSLQLPYAHLGLRSPHICSTSRRRCCQRAPPKAARLSFTVLVSATRTSTCLMTRQPTLMQHLPPSLVMQCALQAASWLQMWYHRGNHPSHPSVQQV